MAKKYYAVARGKAPGIYFTWEECRTQVEQFSGAVYKGFETLQDAEAFLSNVTGNERYNTAEDLQRNSYPDCKGNEMNTSPVSTEQHLIAYVDGSYDHSQMCYAYGCALVLPDEVVTLKGCDNHPDYVSMRNVAGEILGSEQAVLWALEQGYQAVTIYYDYEGIEKWANGIWKANKPGTRRYKEFIAEKRKEIEVSFQKVAAHTGVEYNELADRLAKSALGIDKKGFIGE